MYLFQKPIRVKEYVKEYVIFQDQSVLLCLVQKHKIFQKFEVNGYTFMRSNSQFHFWFPSKLESTLKEKNLLLRSRFFSLRVDPFSEVFCHSGKQAGSHKSCSPL